MEAALFTPVSGIVDLLPLSASPTERAHYRLRLILSARDSVGPTPSQPTLRQELLRVSHPVPFLGPSVAQNSGSGQRDRGNGWAGVTRMHAWVKNWSDGRRKLTRSWPAEQFRTIRDEFKLPWDCVLHSCRLMRFQSAISPD